MKIDHREGEQKFPNYGEDKWLEKKQGRQGSPRDLLYFLLPIAAVAIASFLMRGY